MDEMTTRFGAAARDVMNAYQSASEVVPEIVAVQWPTPTCISGRRSIPAA